jgi:nitronate monooxygenase
MSLPPLFDRLALPVIGSPMFLISNPDLVIAQCKAGIVGSFPALNARPTEMLEEWLKRIIDALAEHNAQHPDRPAAPFAVNQIVHRTNERLSHDLDLCVKYRVPLLITSLGAKPRIVTAASSYTTSSMTGLPGRRLKRAPMGWSRSPPVPGGTRGPCRHSH